MPSHYRTGHHGICVVLAQHCLPGHRAPQALAPSSPALSVVASLEPSSPMRTISGAGLDPSPGLAEPTPWQPGLQGSSGLRGGLPTRLTPHSAPPRSTRRGLHSLVAPRPAPLMRAPTSRGVHTLQGRCLRLCTTSSCCSPSQGPLWGRGPWTLGGHSSVPLSPHPWGALSTKAPLLTARGPTPIPWTSQTYGPLLFDC